MKEPKSKILPGNPRLHYLEWNERGEHDVVLVHGNAANAWWWYPFADAAGADMRLIALDLRGHGDSAWIRPPAYHPADCAYDLRRLILEARLRSPIIVGHSMGGLVALAFTCRYAELTAGVVAVDIAILSNERRDRFLRRLRSLPTVAYPDLDTAIQRFRLIPHQGHIPRSRLAFIAEKSLGVTGDGLFTMKFDRETFFGGDGLNVLEAIGQVRRPLLMVRGALSSVMTKPACALAMEANRLCRLVEIPDAHHHVLLEQPADLAHAVEQFVADVNRRNRRNHPGPPE
jgi:pimeloyl-ACP methyl ester carboxylesterase